MTSRIEGVVARLHALHPRLIDLSLDRLAILLERLDHPETKLPPVIHVAGTNGKGSTCAFLRAIAEAAGLRVHVYTSPHLVRFNERIRLAGALVSDTALADALEEVEAVNSGAPITVFEVITAVAFLLFSRVPADLCVLEVGLGGRFDATNLIGAPVACAITSISLDHREFLGETLAAIAFEKAGIIKPGVPVATGAQPAEVAAVLEAQADAMGARLLRRDRDWSAEPVAGGFRYADVAGSLELPLPALPGAFQIDNAGIAITALRAARPASSGRAGRLPGPRPDARAAIAQGLGRAEWPARLQLLTGRLAGLLPPGWELWLDGGHNQGAGEVLGQHLRSWTDRPLHLVVGMKQAKDAAAFLRPLLEPAASVWAVAEAGQHLALPVEAIIAASGFIARPGPTVATTLRRIAAEATTAPARVLICGSLYLAGEILKADAAGGSPIGSGE